MNSWREFADRPSLDAALADHIATALGEDIARTGSASLAVSGGSTPTGLFRELSGRALDWRQVSVTLVDERWVDPADPDSNERLVRENLLRGPAAAARFVGLKTRHQSADSGLQEATERIAAMPGVFSAVVLGMGGDGHTASWFPRATNLAELIDPENPAPLGLCDPVTAPHRRITLTLPAVLSSRGIIIHITGRDKRAVLESAPQQGYPVAAVLAQSRTPVTTWWAP